MVLVFKSEELVENIWHFTTPLVTTDRADKISNSRINISSKLMKK